MTSPKKIESNRCNGRKSTGPNTQRGKAASRFSALRLGVFANYRLLPDKAAQTTTALHSIFFRIADPQG